MTLNSDNVQFSAAYMTTLLLLNFLNFKNIHSVEGTYLCVVYPVHTKEVHYSTCETFCVMNWICVLESSLALVLVSDYSNNVGPFVSGNKI